MLLIGQKHRTGDEEFVPFFKPPKRLTAAGIPQTRGAITAGSDNVLAVVRVVGRKHRILVSSEYRRAQHLCFLVAFHIPDAHALIIATGDDMLTIGRKHAGANRSAMPAQRRQILARCRVPNPYRVVFTAAEHELALGREAYRADGAVVPGE